MSIILYISWLDSCHQSGWITVAEGKSNLEQLKHETIGFLLEETDYSYVVVQSRSMDGEMIDAVMEIPKVSVMEVKKLLNA